MIKGVKMNLMYAQHRGTQPQIGPIVYRLGHMVFIHKSRVRLPVGLQGLGATCPLNCTMLTLERQMVVDGSEQTSIWGYSITAITMVLQIIN